MRIWLVTGGEPLPIGDGVSDRLYRTGFFAEHLASAGHDVTWWTPNFNHRTKRRFMPKAETVELAPNYRIRLLPSPGYGLNISLRRLADHWAVGRNFARRADSTAPPQVIVASLPTVELAAHSVEYGKRVGVPVVLDLRDMWPELFVWQSPRILQAVVKRIARPLFQRRDACVARADALWAISDDFLSWGLRCARRTRRSTDGVYFMVDGSPAPEDKAVEEARRHWENVLGPADKNETIGCFVGSISHQLDLETIASAAEKIRRRGVNIRFVLAGDGESLSGLVNRYGPASGIVWPGWVDRTRLLALLERCHFGLDPMPERPDFEATINNKAVDYLRAGMGIVSCPDKGALAKLLAENGCGASYPHGNVESLAQILMMLATNPNVTACWSAAAREFARAKLDPARIYGGMTECLGRIVKEKKPAYQE